MDDVDSWRELGQQLRVDSVRASAAAGSGHPTSAMSAADLMAVLFAKYLKYDFARPDNPNNDHLIFSKGHASPLLYSLFKAGGAISDNELLSFRKFNSRFQGHPTPAIKWVNVATGSLGQGLPVAVGIALSGKHLEQTSYRVWVLCGDSEMAEGSMWEAFEHASFSGLDNLTAIIDVNRLGQRGETMVGWDLSKYKERAKAFGWHTIEVDGHDVEQINHAYAEAVATKCVPTVIIAKTMKGKGVTAVENRDGAHGKALEDPDAAIQELGGLRNLVVSPTAPTYDESPKAFPRTASALPTYEVGTKVATRRAYGDTLAALGASRGDIVALDGEVNNSTYTDAFAEAYPERYFEVYIAEQQLVASAIGLQVRDWVPFASTFAAFFTRAYDFIRIAAVSEADIKLIGSHAGVSIGEDGPSQMGLEDMAAIRAVHGSTVLYPSDANQAAQLVEEMADRKGIVYMRTTREPTPVIYDPDQSFHIGSSHLARSSGNDVISIVAAGITLHLALDAAEILAADGISARVIDLYSVKPVDVTLLEQAAKKTGKIITVEDHWVYGGLGDAVLQVFAESIEKPLIRMLAVRDMPTSGTSAELLSAAGIDAEHIVTAARELVGLHTPSTAA